MFLTSLSQQALQLPQTLPWSGAGHVLPLVTTVDVCGQLSGAAWSIIGALNLIIKLSGQLARWSFVHASRVGSQCLTSGVSLQTSKILFRWSRFCTSPESCQRKYFTFLELICNAIAVTHSGCLSASNLLYCASITFLNLYLPRIYA